MNTDRLIVEFDKALRAVFATPASVRPLPGGELPEAVLDEKARRHAAALMRVNHVGEVCAQALYQGQSLTSRTSHVREALAGAAREESEHLAWTSARIADLGGRKSLLNPLWYGGALTLGLFAGALGDKWNLGFLAETERQVEAHLDDHLARLPAADLKSQAVLRQMCSDEAAHAATAVRLGAVGLPLPARLLMKAASRLMTRAAYYV